MRRRSSPACHLFFFSRSFLDLRDSKVKRAQSDSFGQTLKFASHKGAALQSLLAADAAEKNITSACIAAKAAARFAFAG